MANNSCFMTTRFIALLIYILLHYNVFATEKLVAITSIVEHPSLDKAKAGILDALERYKKDSKNDVKIIYKNAQSSISNATLIAKYFISLEPDVIVSISTSSTQILVKALSHSKIPLVFSSVSDPHSAGIMESDLITGSIDSPSIENTVMLIHEMLDNPKKLGLLYNPSEANSVKIVDMIKKFDEFEYLDSQISHSSQIVQAVNMLVGKVDAIYIPSDNTVFSAMPKLVQLSRKYKIPVFSSDPDSVQQGVVACIGYNQYQVGEVAGDLMIRILNGERNIPIQRSNEMSVIINKKSAEELNVTIPKTFMNNKIKIVE